jgi:hypothetical protein
LCNEKGYYFAESGEFGWGDMIKRMAVLGHQKGLLVSELPLKFSNEVFHQFWRGGQMNVSSTTYGEARRAMSIS